MTRLLEVYMPVQMSYARYRNMLVPTTNYWI